MVDLKSKIPKEIIELENIKKIESFRKVQIKAIENGIFNGGNFLICSPTGSGKTLVGEFAILNSILVNKKKAVYIAPLKALALEVYNSFKEKYSKLFNIVISIGDIEENFINPNFDFLILTSEKFDSIIRHDLSVLNNIGVLVVDEIHLIDSENRGPTLEILISLLMYKFDKIRIIGLSATIGNSNEIATWLNAKLIKDDWRPTILEHHILEDRVLKRYK